MAAATTLAKQTAKTGLKQTAKAGLGNLVTSTVGRQARAGAAKAAREAALRAGRSGARGGRVVARAGANAGRVAARAGAKVGRGVAGAARACIKNKKMCAGAVAAAGVGAYMYDKYGDMEDEKKQCMSTCFPEDWQEYVDGQISTPNYKVIGGRSKKDQDLTYAELYEDDEVKGSLCTLETLAANKIPEGKDSCNQFCEEACGFDFNDLVRETVSDATGGAKNLGDSVFEGIFDGLGIDFKQVKKYGIIALVTILILSVLSILIKVAL